MMSDNNGHNYLGLKYQSDRRFSPTGNKNYDIETLWDHHYEILRLLAEGNKPKEVAEMTGYGLQTISNVRQSSAGRAHLAMLQRGRDVNTMEVKDRIDRMQNLALDTLEGILDGTDEEASVTDRRHTAKDILDRGGHAAPKSPESVNNTYYLSKTEIAELHMRDPRSRGHSTVSKGLTSNKTIQRVEPTEIVTEQSNPQPEPEPEKKPDNNGTVPHGHSFADRLRQMNGGE